MTHEEKDIRHDLHRAPFTVPDGYFDSLSQRIAAKLPERETPAPAPKMSFWHRAKPYVYLAAMFAGIWCMMKAIQMTGGAPTMLDNPPQEVVVAMNNADVYEFYTEESDLDDFEIEREVSTMYSNMDEFERDFGYQLDPDLKNLDI